MSWMGDLWRQSTVRLTISLCAIFMLISFAAGLYMVRQIGNDVRGFVDRGLVEMYQVLLSDQITETQLRQEIAESEGAFGYEQGYRSADGTVYGNLRSNVFDTPGFATLQVSDLLLVSQDILTHDYLDEDVKALGVWRVYVAPYRDGMIALTEPIGDIDVALDNVFPVIQLVALPIIFVTLLAGLFLGWQQQRRMAQIRQAIGALSRGDLSPPKVPAQVRDDLDEVMVGIGSAAEQLEQSFGQMRRFSQNMAHELRTPLARLRADIEALPESERTEAALAQTDQVIHVFDAVQRITRLSEHGKRSTFDTVDLRRVGDLIGDLYEDVSHERGRKLLIENNDPATVKGDFQLIAQMASNLVENALNHGAGTIRFQIDQSKITISDDGPGIAPDKLERLLQPFEKDDSKGTGLGLALVQAIARYHDAQVKVEAGVGCRISIDLGARG